MKQSSKVDGRPAFQWYPDDWLSEAGLRTCELSARGLWIDLLCFMFRMPERGKLRINRRPMSLAELSRMVGKPEAEVEANLKQLLDLGVAEKSDDGTIYSRRMVADESKRQAKVRAGRKGGRSKRQAEGGSSSPFSSSSSPSSSFPSSSSSMDNEERPAPEPVISVNDDLAKRLANTYRNHSVKKELYHKAICSFRQALEAGLNAGDIEQAIVAADKLAPPWEVVNGLRTIKRPASESFAERDRRELQDQLERVTRHD